MDTLAKLRAGQLKGLKRLDLACGLTEFPDEIFQLANSLEILNLSGNALSRLPDDLHRLTRLRILFCSDNHWLQSQPDRERAGYGAATVVALADPHG